MSEADIPATGGSDWAEPVREIADVEELLGFLAGYLEPDLDHWFRGHASSGWDLSASVFRTPASRENEQVLLKRFIQEARRHVTDVPDRHWDWVFLAQHHQVPTRLLDWSENPLVALYFAAQDHLDIANDPTTARDGSLWLLRPAVMNALNGFTFSTPRDIPLFGIDPVLDDYDPFTGVDDQQPQPPVAALVARTFDRISAQWGTFTVCNSPTALDTLPNHQAFITDLTIPIAAKPDIRRQLDLLRLEDRIIYPDLFRLGRKLSEDFA